MFGEKLIVLRYLWDYVGESFGGLGQVSLVQ